VGSWWEWGEVGSQERRAGEPDSHACAPGFNPHWGQTLQFQLRAPELVLVRFVVEDYDSTSPNDFVGQFTLPFNSLKQGWWKWVGREQDEVQASWVLFIFESVFPGAEDHLIPGCPPPHRVPSHPPAFQGRGLAVSSHTVRPHQHPALFRA
jgi:hypothetical protein